MFSRKTARRLKARHVEDGRRVAIALEYRLRLIPHRQVKLPAGECEEGNPSPPQFLLEMLAKKTRAARNQEVRSGAGLSLHLESI